MTALYEIVSAYKQDLARLEDLDIDDQTFIDTLEGMQGELQHKATNVGMFYRNLEVTAEAIKDAEGQLSKRRKALENKAERLKRYLLDCMQAAGIQKIESPMLSLKIKNNPPAVEIFDEAQVPADYWREPPPPPKSIDKALVKQAIKDGFDVPGAKTTQSVRLEIK